MTEKSFSIHTLGCKVNTYESDLMVTKLKEAGFIKKDFSEPADIYIINTCTVTNIADRKSRQMLRRARKMNPDSLIVAAGCYVEDAKMNGKLDELIREKVIDVAVGNREKQDIVSFINDKFAEKAQNDGTYAENSKTFGHEKQECNAAECGRDEEALKGKNLSSDNSSANISEEKYDAYGGGRYVTELDGHTRAFIKIQDGCNMFCSYCVIPYVRGMGKLWFRDTESICEEVESLAKKKVSEIVLTGIHMSSMKDRLADVVEAVARIEGVERIRLGSLEPTLITEDFTKRLSHTKKLCPHFHLSLQSGSDTVLKRMNRHYTAEDYKKSCDIIRKYFKRPAITTDIIVGFPGETDEEFSETMNFVKEIGLYEAHVFKYSRRSGTWADKMPGQLTENEKAKRSEELIALTEAMSHDFRKQFLGEKTEFISEELIEISGKTYETGYTDNYVRCVKETDKLHMGSIIEGIVSEIRNEKEIDDFLVLI